MRVSVRMCRVIISKRVCVCICSYDCVCMYIIVCVSVCVY